jgi:hypothetical protein
MTGARSMPSEYLLLARGLISEICVVRAALTHARPADRLSNGTADKDGGSILW